MSIVDKKTELVPHKEPKKVNETKPMKLPSRKSSRTKGEYFGHRTFKHLSERY